MSQPSVNITTSDGGLGVIPLSGVKLLAVVGTSSIGTANTPATFTRVPSLVTAFGEGPAVRDAARAIKLGIPVVVVKTAAATNVGAYGTPVDGITGTSDVTFDDDVEPFDDYDFIFEVTTGGTVGTSASYRYSLDGGASYSPITALGTANNVTVAGNIKLEFGAGTLVTGDTISVRTSAPRWDDTELLAALNALKASVVNWGIASVVGDCSATSAGVIETWAQGLDAAKKYRAYIASARLPAVGESESTYLSSLSTAFANFTTTHGGICAGACDMVSSINGKTYRRPIQAAVAARLAAVSEEIDLASIEDGRALAGVSLYDANGNPKHHDESANPGLDDARFITLRTFDGEPGVFVNNPRLMSSPTSDFRYLQHRRVMNLALESVDSYMRRRLSKSVRVKASTGTITEVEASEIESGQTAALAASLLAKPKASSVSVALSRTDNLLATETLTVDVGIQPLGYAKTINATVGFAATTA